MSKNIGQYEFGKDGRLIFGKSASPLAYYKIHWFLYTWARCPMSLTQGCAAIRKAELSLDKPAPTQRGAPASPAASPPLPAPPPLTREQKQAAKNEKFVENLLKAGDAIQSWWTAPMPSLFPPRLQGAPSAPTAAPVSAEPAIPPFDLQDLPDVQDRIKLPVSAEMMRFWFAGRPNYSTRKADVQKAIDQNGKPYAPDMIDHDIIKLEWVLGFPRAKEMYDDLIAKAIHTSKAREELAACLHNFVASNGSANSSFANGLAACGSDIHRLHATFQFQRAGVDSTPQEKALQYLLNEAGVVRAPDDLTGALGSFAFYAAAGDIRFSAAGVATLESIYVYVRDSYSFLDEDPAYSQYLGHWSEKGVYLAPTPALGQRNEMGWADAPLVDVNESIYKKGAIMYPVSNKSFRDWRVKHGQGGDFIVYTKPRHIRLLHSIQVRL